MSVNPSSPIRILSLILSCVLFIACNSPNASLDALTGPLEGVDLSGIYQLYGVKCFNNANPGVPSAEVTVDPSSTRETLIVNGNSMITQDTSSTCSAVTTERTVFGSDGMVTVSNVNLSLVSGVNACPFDIRFSPVSGPALSISTLSGVLRPGPQQGFKAAYVQRSLNGINEVLILTGIHNSANPADFCFLAYPKQ